MSSILEALRELEADRRPKTTPSIPAAEPPRAIRTRRIAVPMALAGGVVAGALAVAAYLGSGGATPETNRPEPARREAPAAPAERPAWLDDAEAPMARVTPSGPGGVPEPARTAAPPVAASATPSAAPAVPAQAASAAAVRPAPTASSAVRSLQVESVEYDVPAARRSVTLLLDGDRVTLREGESADGVSVQLITPDGAYLQRGGEVFLAAPRR